MDLESLTFVIVPGYVAFLIQGLRIAITGKNLKIIYLNFVCKLYEERRHLVVKVNFANSWDVVDQVQAWLDRIYQLYVRVPTINAVIYIEHGQCNLVLNFFKLLWNVEILILFDEVTHSFVNLVALSLFGFSKRVKLFVCQIRHYILHVGLFGQPCLLLVKVAFDLALKLRHWLVFIVFGVTPFNTTLQFYELFLILRVLIELA